MNPAKVQRTLFRMQFDASFAASIQRGDSSAVAHLEADELTVLQKADPIGVSADVDGKRKTQALGNILKEYVLSATAADARGEALGLGFFESPEFHQAIAHGRRLPLAFFDFAQAQAAVWGHHDVVALLAVEGAMVGVRRSVRKKQELKGGELVLAPGVSVRRLPTGAIALAEDWRARIDKKAAQPSFTMKTEEEFVLLRCQPTKSVFAYPEVAIEVLNEPIAELFESMVQPVGQAARAKFATSIEASPDDLEAFLDGFVEEGALMRGRSLAQDPDSSPS